ncbi:MAG: 2-phosphosulfolactate phosphatase [Bacteroidales bacterium]|nr:2-phosphosulfolactate phosphatase [Bacteroidales bacterium]
MQEKYTIEVCFTPALYHLYDNPENTVVIVDVLRATSSICAAFAAGAKKILPVATVEQAREVKQQGYILAAERDGKVLEFADFGNSPDLFTPERVKDKVIAYSTTNGTQAIQMASKAKQILIGSFTNLSTVIDYLIQHPTPVLFLCSGWKNKFNLEDSLCVGAMANKLLESGKYKTICDSTHAAIDLWKIAEPNLMAYLEKASHRHRLKSIVDDRIIRYCHTIDLVKVLPAFRNGFLENILK